MVWLFSGVIIVVVLLWGLVWSRQKIKKRRRSVVWVVMVRNQDEIIEEIIWRLRRLQRSFCAFDELVVVDCGSNDQTVEILQRLWRQKQDFYLSLVAEGDEPGKSGKGIEEICWLDSDPVIHQIDLRQLIRPLVPINRRQRKATVNY